MDSARDLRLIGIIDWGRFFRDLRAYRESQGYSQRRFAALLGGSRRTVESWEKGRTGTHSEPFLLLCAIMGKTPQDYIHRDRLERILTRIQAGKEPTDDFF